MLAAVAAYMANRVEGRIYKGRKARKRDTNTVGGRPVMSITTVYESNCGLHFTHSQLLKGGLQVGFTLPSPAYVTTFIIIRFTSRCFKENVSLMQTFREGNLAV